MNFQLKGGAILGLIIDDKQIAMESCSFSHFTIRESIFYSLPTVDFSINDFANQITKGSIAHGSKISVLIGSETSGFTDWYSFSVFNQVSLDNRSTGGTTYTVSCIYDLYNYIFDKTPFSLEMTSSEVVKRIASNNKMFFSCDPTNDKQVWMNTTLTQARFLQDVVTDQAYLDDTSVFKLGFSLVSRTLKFRNLSLIKPKSRTLVLSNMPSLNPDLLFTEYSYLNTGGQASVTNGVAGVNTHEKDILTGGQNKYDKVNVTVNNKAINIQKSVAGTVKTKVRVAPLNMGNTHDNSQKATHQNRRLNALYSMQVEVLVHKYSELELFDPAFIHILDPSTGKPDKATEGLYILAARGRCAIMSQYAEKLVFIRNSLNDGS
jgi:hypothetical protein